MNVLWVSEYRDSESLYTPYTTWDITGVAHNELHITKFHDDRPFKIWVDNDPSDLTFETLEEAQQVMYAMAVLSGKYFIFNQTGETND